MRLPSQAVEVVRTYSSTPNPSLNENLISYFMHALLRKKKKHLRRQILNLSKSEFLAQDTEKQVPELCTP